MCRGTLTALRTERDFRSATRLADGIAAASLDDPADPAVSGEGFFYLVRGAAGSAAECRRDTYGTTLRDITGLACP